MGIRKEQEIEWVQINSMFAIKRTDKTNTYINKKKDVEREMMKGYMKMLSNCN